MMTKRSRILILIASLAMGLMYVLPVWTIDLEAPQYPEGLGMVIRINTIEGKKEHDLGNINNLNHYIGMRRIVPESIPELKIMPVVVGVLMVFGGLVALIGRKRFLYGWVVVVLAFSGAGMADFWKWEYDYGHNLDEENAIIKIPGMSYQPPLIGSRQILNFTAHSWPGGGGLAAILATATAVAVAATEWRRGRMKKEDEDDGGTEPEGESEVEGAEVEVVEGDVGVEVEGKDEVEDRSGGDILPLRPVGVALVALLLAGCGEPEPRPLVVGTDGCEDCLMMVDASGHGSELVTTTGKIYTFDSVECLTNYLTTYDGEEVPYSLWVTDFANPDRLVNAEEAYYLRSEALTSPMGLGLTAFSRVEDRDGAVHAFGGDALDWGATVTLVAESWPDGRPTMKHAGHSETLLPGGAQAASRIFERPGG